MAEEACWKVPHTGWSGSGWTDGDPTGEEVLEALTARERPAESAPRMTGNA